MENDSLMLDEERVKENYLILLLGCVDKPIRGEIHLQKEMFILANSFPIMRNFFSFDEHLFGPWDKEINEIVDESFSYKEAFQKEDGKISLTNSGKEIYSDLIKENEDKLDFQYLMSAMQLVRKLYDNLTNDELLLLIYLSYPNFKINSIKYKELVENKDRRRKLLDNLLEKSIITVEKYNEFYV